MWSGRITYLTIEQRRDPRYLRTIAKQLRYLERKEARKRVVREAA